MYDNFDYREGVKHQLISNHAEMRSVTTGRVFRGADIPSGGLKKSMLHREVPLTIEDLLYSPGAAVYDEIAAKIAARENATSLAASSQIASIASGLRIQETGTRSTHFAELLQRSTMASLAGRFSDANDQGVKTAGFFVLLGAEMPSVLFETSFISNPAEEKRLATADYRQRLADGIVNAVRAYREGR